MRRRLGVKWLNFLYSFFGFIIIYKGILAVGTLAEIVNASKGGSFETIFSTANVITFCAFTLMLTDVAFKFLALFKSSKKEGYSLMMWALALGTISSVFYVFSDQGWLTGLVFMIFDVGLFLINFFYVKKRKDYYGNPDLL